MDEVRRLGALEGAEITTQRKFSLTRLPRLFTARKRQRRQQAAAKALFANGGKTTICRRPYMRRQIWTQERIFLALLVETKLAPTRSEARRLVQQGGVTVNDEKVTDIYRSFTCEDMDADGALVIRKGKKVYHKVKAE